MTVSEGVPCDSARVRVYHVTVSEGVPCHNVMKNRFEVGVVSVVRMAACMCPSSLKLGCLNRT